MRLIGAITVLLLASGCGGPQRGSQEDLSSQIESLDLPASMVKLDEFYSTDCVEGVPCPTFVRWFDLRDPLDSVKLQILNALSAAGLEYDEGGRVAVISGRKDGYIFFIVLEQSMLTQNQFAPPGTKAEIAVSPLEIEG